MVKHDLCYTSLRVYAGGVATKLDPRSAVHTPFRHSYDSEQSFVLWLGCSCRQSGLKFYLQGGHINKNPIWTNINITIQKV